MKQRMTVKKALQELQGRIWLLESRQVERLTELRKAEKPTDYEWGVRVGLGIVSSWVGKSLRATGALPCYLHETAAALEGIRDRADAYITSGGEVLKAEGEYKAGLVAGFGEARDVVSQLVEELRPEAEALALEFAAYGDVWG